MIFSWKRWIFLTLFVLPFNAVANLNFFKDNTLLIQSQASTTNIPNIVKPYLKPSMLSNYELPKDLKISGENYQIEYTINPELESFISMLLLRYRSDYMAVVVVDNNNGDILAALDYDRKRDKVERNLVFSATHPAASIFKVITAADLLENTHISNETEFIFSGKSTTLYKSQLKGANKRWIKRTDLEEAFARSNNVIFGKAAIDNLSASGLKKMAEKFGFNRSIFGDLSGLNSIFPKASDQYNLAELASGYNVKTMISPVHGASIASIISNGGILKKPHLIREIKLKDKSTVWTRTIEDEPVVTVETADVLKKMMQQTVFEGTARRAFRKHKTLLDTIEVGGKTGSITGGIPYGKRDWFVSYAKLSNDKNDKGVSICVMIVNVKRWYIKSTQLTQMILDNYYEQLYRKKSE
jgi:peptidoglycan glycosyltransferase